MGSNRKSHVGRDKGNGVENNAKILKRVKELRKDIYIHEESISRIDRLLADKDTEVDKSKLRKEKRMLYDEYRELLQEFNKYAVKGKTSNVNRENNRTQPPVSDKPVDGAIYKDKERVDSPEYKEYKNKMDLISAAINGVNKRIENIDECLKYEFLSDESKRYLLDLRKEYAHNLQSYSAQMYNFINRKTRKKICDELLNRKQERENKDARADEGTIADIKNIAGKQNNAKNGKGTSQNNSRSARSRYITTKSSVWPVGWPKRK